MVMNIFKKYYEGTYRGDIYSRDGRFEITDAVGYEAAVRNWVLESQTAEIGAKVIGSSSIRLYTSVDVCFGERGTAEKAKIGATSFQLTGRRGVPRNADSVFLDGLRGCRYGSQPAGCRRCIAQEDG